MWQRYETDFEKYIFFFSTITISRQQPGSAYRKRLLLVDTCNQPVYNFHVWTQARSQNLDLGLVLSATMVENGIMVANTAPEESGPNKNETGLLLAKPFGTIVDPSCFGLQELSGATELRDRVSKMIRKREDHSEEYQPSSSLIESSSLEGEPQKVVDTHPNLSYDSPLFIHLAHGLAYTVGSALGTTPPSLETCLAAYLVPNSVGLTAGSRAWSKHCHRSQPTLVNDNVDGGATADKRKRPAAQTPSGWWGRASGPQSVINANALALFYKVMDNATWRNLHWLPHQVLVYEVRVSEGYGMRWSQDQSDQEAVADTNDTTSKKDRSWIFRGFLEPTMENGHEVKWRHPLP